jgi:hypothetical protein
MREGTFLTWIVKAPRSREAECFETAPMNCCAGAREANLIMIADKSRAPGEHGRYAAE